MSQTLLFISESKQENLTMRTQLPFHEDNFKFSIQMLIVSLVCTARCVEQVSKCYILSEVPNLNLSV